MAEQYPLSDGYTSDSGNSTRSSSGSSKCCRSNRSHRSRKSSLSSRKKRQPQRRTIQKPQPLVHARGHPYLSDSKRPDSPRYPVSKSRRRHSTRCYKPVRQSGQLPPVSSSPQTTPVSHRQRRYSDSPLPSRSVQFGPNAGVDYRSPRKKKIYRKSPHPRGRRSLSLSDAEEVSVEFDDSVTGPPSGLYYIDNTPRGRVMFKVSPEYINDEEVFASNASYSDGFESDTPLSQRSRASPHRLVTFPNESCASNASPRVVHRKTPYPSTGSFVADADTSIEYGEQATPHPVTGRFLYHTTPPKRVYRTTPHPASGRFVGDEDTTFEPGYHQPRPSRPANPQTFVDFKNAASPSPKRATPRSGGRSRSSSVGSTPIPSQRGSPLLDRSYHSSAGSTPFQSKQVTPLSRRSASKHSPLLSRSSKSGVKSSKAKPRDVPFEPLSPVLPRNVSLQPQRLIFDDDESEDKGDTSGDWGNDNSPKNTPKASVFSASRTPPTFIDRTATHTRGIGAAWQAAHPGWETGRYEVKLTEDNEDTPTATPRSRCSSISKP